MAQGSHIRSVRLRPSHPFTELLHCSPDKCQRRMGEMPIFKKAVPLPKIIGSYGCSFHFSHFS